MVIEQTEEALYATPLRLESETKAQAKKAPTAAVKKKPGRPKKAAAKK